MKNKFEADRDRVQNANEASASAHTGANWRKFIATAALPTPC